jgi:hypothetical protein
LAKETPPRGQAGSHGTEALHEALRGLDVEHEALPLVAEGLDVEHEAPLTTGDVEHEALPRVTGDLSGWQRNNFAPPCNRLQGNGCSLGRAPGGSAPWLLLGLLVLGRYARAGVTGITARRRWCPGRRRRCRSTTARAWRAA